MTIECPFCKAELTHDELTLGRRVQCPYCGEKFDVSKSHIKCRTARLKLIILAVVVAMAIVAALLYVFMAGSLAHNAPLLVQSEIPTNTFSYVKNRLAILSLPDAQGSGFVLEMNGKKYLITNEHVVRCGNGAKPRAVLLSGETLELGACDIAKDRDLIRFEVPSNTVSLHVSNEIPEIGDEIVVYGNSDGLGVSTKVPGKVLGVGGDRIEIDAEFVAGNSGSPVINERGRVDGVATYLLWPKTSARDRRERGEQHGSGVRRFATRLSGAKWMSIGWDEYVKQIKFCDDIVRFVHQLSPYLKVDTNNFVPNGTIQISEADKARYFTMGERFYPALIKMNSRYESLRHSYANLVRTQKRMDDSKSQPEIADFMEHYNTKARAEYFVCSCLFNQCKFQAIQLVKETLQNASITILDVEDLNGDDVKTRFNAELEREQADLKSQTELLCNSDIVDLATEKMKSRNNSTREYGVAVLSYMVGEEDCTAGDEFLSFCENDRADDGLHVAQVISQNSIIMLEEAYANGKKKVGYILGCVAYNNSMYSKAVNYWTAAAEQGMSHAQYLLGVCYGMGRGVVLDTDEAFEWYAKAAKGGCVDAQYNLGVCYAVGAGVKQSSREAIKLYRPLADAGDADAQYNLGVHFKYGWGVGKDENEANKWFKTANEHGHKRPATVYGDIGKESMFFQWIGLFKNEFGIVEKGEHVDLSKANEEQGEKKPTPAPAPVVTPPSADDAELMSKVVTTERVRRQAFDVQVKREIDAARTAMKNGEYEASATHYILANKLLNDRPDTKGLRRECLQGIGEAYYRAALQESCLGNRTKAIELMEKAVDMRHPKARRVLEQWAKGKK